MDAAEPSPNYLMIGYGDNVILHLTGPSAIAASVVLSLGILALGGVGVFAFFRD
jgi:hypothetical protein